jgi:hypothetical protein
MMKQKLKSKCKKETITENNSALINKILMVLPLLAFSFALFQYGFSEYQKVKQKQYEAAKEAYKIIISYPYDNSLRIADLIINIGIFNNQEKSQNKSDYFKSIARMIVKDLNFENQKHILFSSYIYTDLYGLKEYLKNLGKTYAILICQKVVCVIKEFSLRYPTIAANTYFVNDGTYITAEDMQNNDEPDDYQEYYIDLIKYFNLVYDIFDKDEIEKHININELNAINSTIIEPYILSK